MAKRRFELSPAQKAELQQGYQESRDGATRTRYQAVRLYGEGYAVAEIGHITGCARSSLMEWCDKYQAAGLNGLTEHRGGRRRAKLSLEQLAELDHKLRQYCPRDVLGSQTHTSSGQYWTVEDLAVVLERWYGVRWASRSGYHRVFAFCHFTYQRSEKVYKSRREADVADFEARLEKS
jgi:transposase